MDSAIVMVDLLFWIVVENGLGEHRFSNFRVMLSETLIPYRNWTPAVIRAAHYKILIQFQDLALKISQLFVETWGTLFWQFRILGFYILFSSHHFISLMLGRLSYCFFLIVLLESQTSYTCFVAFTKSRYHYSIVVFGKL